jgi:hypothetical protein
MFNNALSGIAAAGLMSTILVVAYGILLASLLFSAYEAWVRGGDTRMLGVAGLKYLALGLLFVNGGVAYDSVFRSVVGTFNQMSHTMAGAGPGDVLAAWKNELVSAGSSWDTFLNLATGVVAGVFSASLLLVAMVLYPVAYAVFTVLYSLYGTILYVTGPLVLALMPSLGVGTLARRYAVNVVIFGAWGLIYGIFCRLALALNINSMAAITGAGTFGGLLTGATAEVLLAAASILFSVCILLIPFLAKRIVEGDLGSTMFAALATTAALAQSAVAFAAGSGDGFGRAAASGASDGGSSSAATAGSSGTPPAGPSPSGAGSATASPAPTAVPGSGTQAPTGPSVAGGRRMGDMRPVNIPHAVGWLAGATAAAGVRGGQRAVSAGRRLVTGGAAGSRSGSSDTS